MSYGELLVHRCEVRRRDDQRDRFGQPVEPSANRHADAEYDCRLEESRPSERFTERARDVVVSTHTLFLSLDAEIVEADRVTVRNSTGQILVENANVTGVLAPEDATGPHHVEAKLSATRSGERKE